MHYHTSQTKPSAWRHKSGTWRLEDKANSPRPHTDTHITTAQTSLSMRSATEHAAGYHSAPVPQRVEQSPLGW